MHFLGTFLGPYDAIFVDCLCTKVKNRVDGSLMRTPLDA